MGYRIYGDDIEPLNTVAQAEALSYSKNTIVSVLETGRVYQFDPASTATRDGIRVLTPAGGGRLLAIKTGSDDVEIPKIGTPGHQSLTQSLQVGLSTGACNGNFVTDAGDGAINIASGEGMIRAANSSDSKIFSFRWPETNGVAIPLNSVRYVGVEYNGGSPQAVVRTANNWNGQTEFQAATVVNEGGTLHILNNPQETCDGVQKIFHRLIETQPFQYAERVGGGRFSETGTRNLSLSPCEFYDGLNEFPITTKNTSTGDTFDSYYGSFTKVASQTQWDNQNYDNAGTLTALSANRYGVHWLYIEMDDSFALIYGKGNYNTISDAEAALPPASLPLRLSLGSRLAAKLIFQKGAASAIQIESAFDVKFQSGMPVSHSGLSDVLGNGDYHLSESERDAATRIATTSQSGLMSAAQAQSVVNSAVAGSTGQIQHNNGGALGADQDLFWDIDNKRFGVGTSSLLSKNVTHVTTNSDGIRVQIQRTPTLYEGPVLLFGHNTNNGTQRVFSYIKSLMRNGSDTTWYGDLSFFVGGSTISERVTISGSTGNVGFGTPSPTSRIHGKSQTSDSTSYCLKLDDSLNNGKFYVRADGQVDSSGSIIIGFDVLTSDVTLTQSSKHTTIANPSGAGMVLTLHLSPPDGIKQVIVNASVYSVTIGRNGQKIAGLESNYTLAQNSSIVLQFFGATLGWLIISNG